jgi:hypothetical protein
MWHLPTFCVTIIVHTFNLRYLGIYFVTPTQNTFDYGNIGTRDWSGNHKSQGMGSTMVVMKYIKCFTFNLKELGQLKR